MTIQVDSREKAKAIKNILMCFDQYGIKHPISKLMVGDYMNYDNPRVIIDRKQNLSELCSNVCQGHERFRRELLLAQENGIHLIVLCEHGKEIEKLSDVIWWRNPRLEKRIQKNGTWITVKTKATTGKTLYLILKTLQEKYGVEFLFCQKSETGKRIIELLKG